MPTALTRPLAWLVAAGHNGELWWGVGISIGLAVVSLVVAAAVVLSWPATHFQHGERPKLWAKHHPALRVLGFVAKNLAGAVLVLLGLIMALPGVPGQGILTMIIGLTLLDFPGKLALERRLMGRPLVLRPLNALRARFHRPALELD